MAPSLLKSRQHSSEAELGILPLLNQLERGEELLLETETECYSVKIVKTVRQETQYLRCECTQCQQRTDGMVAMIITAGEGLIETQYLEIFWGPLGEKPTNSITGDYSPMVGNCDVRARAAIQLAAILAGRKLSQLTCGSTISSTTTEP